MILSGFSGSGKGTIVNRLLEKYDNYALSVSATTREPRPGEREGVNYFFRTQDEFDRMIERDEFLEYARYVGHSYGTPKAYVEQQLASGKNVILEIEIQGALHVKEQHPEAVLVFVTPPGARELERRLTGRGTETPEVIRSRMARAVEESAYMDRYDYLVINDELEDAVDQFHAIVTAQGLHTGSQKDFILEMKRDLADNYAE